LYSLFSCSINTRGQFNITEAGCPVLCAFCCNSGSGRQRLRVCAQRVCIEPQQRDGGVHRVRR
jgi:hypothetical protein